MNPAVKDPHHVFIVGCGDIGQRVACLWQKRDVTVSGLVRSESRAAILKNVGINPVVADLDDPATLIDLPVTDALIYYLAPPPVHGNTDPRMKHFLQSLAQTRLPTRIVAISTSGVYGDHQGRQVSEHTPPNPQVDRARRRLDAESQLRAFGTQHKVDIIILRVGGIYGPGRLPVERLQQQIPIIHEHLAPQTNRIHADDLARVCLEAARRGRANTIYNVSDGTNSNMTEYFNTVADFLNLPRPPTIDWEEAERTLSKGMLSYLRESRHMDNTRMKQELGITLLYPDLQTGLAACKD